LQIATLTKKNKILAQKYKEHVNVGTQVSKKATAKQTELQSTEKAEEIFPDSSSSQTEVTSCYVSYLVPSRAQMKIKLL